MSKPDRRKSKPRSGDSLGKRPTRRGRTPRESLVTFFRSSPLAEAMAAGEIELKRDRDEIRDIGL